MSVQTVGRRPPEKANKWVKTKIRVKRYEFGGIVGRGAFSKVYLARTSKFLLGEDKNERALQTTETLAVGVTRNRRSKTRTRRILRPAGTSLPLPQYVAMKVMKVRAKREHPSLLLRNPGLPEGEPYRGPSTFEEQVEKLISKQRRNNVGSELAKKLYKAAMKAVSEDDLSNYMIPATGTNNARKVGFQKNSNSFESNERLGSCDLLRNMEEPRASLLVNENDDRRRQQEVNAMPIDEIIREIECLKMVRECKFCVYLHDVVQLEKEVWLVMDYCHIGTLSSFLRHVFRRQKKIDCDLIRWFMAPILLALNYLHERGMIHRDVKEGNILLSRAGIPKLCDFGLVKHFDSLPVPVEEAFAGTPAYAPPELFMNENKQFLVRERKLEQRMQSEENNLPMPEEEAEELCQVDTSFDTWSVALTMLSLLFGTSPWEYSPTVVGKNGKPKRFRRPKFPEKQLTRYLGSQLQSEVKLHGYGKLHKRLFLLEPSEIESDPKLKLPKIIPPKYLPKFSTDKREMVDFVKKCVTLRAERPTLGRLLADPYLKATVKDWERFDSNKEREMLDIARTGKIRGRKVTNRFGNKEEKSSFRTMMEKVALLAYNSFKRGSE